MRKILSPQRFIAGIVLLVFLLIPLMVKSNYILNIFIMIFFYGYLAYSWNILGGFLGQHSFGHALFVGIGAYTSTLLFTHLNLTPWIGMWAGGVCGGLAGLFLGYLSFRYGLKGPYFIMVTIAFAETFMYIALNIRAIGGASGLNVPLMGHNPFFFQFSEKIYYYYIILAMITIIMFITYMIRKKRMGFYLLAIRENEDAAQILGVAAMKYKLFATVISAFFCALGGTFYAQYIMFIDPPSILGLGLSVEMVIYVFIGGEGTVLGPLFGAFFLFPLGELTRNIFAGQTGGIHLMIYGAIFVVAMIFMPEGIVGKLLKSRFRRWVQ
jgi:branched-chain amino acid transport system permease protein